MESKKNNLILVLTTFTFFVLIGYSAYAYFEGGVAIGSNLLLLTNAYASPVFSTYSTDGIAISIDESSLITASNVSTNYDNGNIIIDFSSSKEDTTVYCTYDIDLEWVGENSYTIPSTTLPSGDYNFELSIQGSRTTTNDTSGHTYENKDLSEIDISNLTDSWDCHTESLVRVCSATMVEEAEIYSKSLTPTHTVWDFRMSFYVLPVNQSSILGKEYNARIVVKNIVC